MLSKPFSLGPRMKKVAPLNVVLDHDECVRLFGSQTVARLCVLEDDFPVAFPVNYRLMVEDTENVVFVIRTRADGILDQPGRNVSFQIDGVNPVTQRGWSVLARGVLHEDNSEGARQWLRLWNPRPWVGDLDINGGPWVLTASCVAYAPTYDGRSLCLSGND